jgi:hypothetical protein
MRAVMAALTLLALKALMAPSALATDTPQLLALEGKASELKATPKGGANRPEGLTGKTITATVAELKLENCTSEIGKEKT